MNVAPQLKKNNVCQIFPRPPPNQCWSLFPALWSFRVWSTLCRGEGGKFYLGLGCSKIRQKRPSVSLLLKPIVVLTGLGMNFYSNYEQLLLQVPTDSSGMVVKSFSCRLFRTITIQPHFRGKVAYRWPKQKCWLELTSHTEYMCMYQPHTDCLC